MKFTWEERDIKCGKYIYYPSEEFTNTRVWKIGFVGGSSRKDKDGSGFVLISVVDGMVGLPHSDAELVKSFNENGAEPIDVVHKYCMYNNQA